MDKFLVRKAKKEDSKKIWEIRNHSLSRKNFNNPDEILWEDHKAWFDDKYFNWKDNYCFVLVDKSNKVIGYCRFDFETEEKFYIVSIAVNPNNYNQGLGSKLLSESIKRIEDGRSILAEVHKNNISSLKLFEKNNFKIYKENNEKYYLKI